MKKVLLIIVFLCISGCRVREGEVVEKIYIPYHRHMEYKYVREYQDEYYITIVNNDGEKDMWLISKPKYDSINIGDKVTFPEED